VVLVSKYYQNNETGMLGTNSSYAWATDAQYRQKEGFKEFIHQFVTFGLTSQSDKFDYGSWTQISRGTYHSILRNLESQFDAQQKLGSIGVNPPAGEPTASGSYTEKNINPLLLGVAALIIFGVLK
jgi:hypothetical protein